MQPNNIIFSAKWDNNSQSQKHILILLTIFSLAADWASKKSLRSHSGVKPRRDGWRSLSAISSSPGRGSLSLSLESLICKYLVSQSEQKFLSDSLKSYNANNAAKVCYLRNHITLTQLKYIITKNYIKKKSSCR